MAGSIEELIKNLKDISLESEEEKAIEIIKHLYKIEVNKLENYDFVETFLPLLRLQSKSLLTEVAKCIAEMTKNEPQRKKFTNKEIIELLIRNLHNLEENFEIEPIIQVCRALGNICYLNDEGRSFILSCKGDEDLIKLLNVELKEVNKTNECQFIKVRGGLISNYLLGNENLAKHAMDLNIMKYIEHIFDNSVKNVEENEILLLNTLPILSILTENVADLNFNSKLNIQLAEILAASTNPDLAELCLELLHYQAENDEVKILLAKSGLCETIYKLLETYKNLASSNEAKALMKLACDLIVLILTGDEAMNYLYSTPLLKDMENWLDSSDTDLLTTGVLALGNFARTDSHCIYMVENKVMHKLLDILAKNNSAVDDIRLQHALLSALRNLVIPKPNKNAIIEAGLVRTILPMLQIHQPPVVFKLLGTLRMTVDGQELLATELLQNEELIKQLVHWSKSSDYAGVTGESLRLMAWLIKHAYLTKATMETSEIKEVNVSIDDSLCQSLQRSERTSLEKFVKINGAVESMVNMLTSQHLVMQNEAIIALIVLSIMFPAASMTEETSPSNSVSDINLDEIYIQCKLGAQLAEFLQRTSESMTKEIIENVQKLVSLLKKYEKLVTHLEENKIDVLLGSIPILTEYCTL
ncbi:GTPase-GDP dissociation stimulator vimar [Condylostylus longicornis]|uniref:GTPase-GDP dissociation stimulator vimar n=1 Tax=Condylostylus longicornis TaxID=2530218 RepID=UPI00244DB9D0|nr:GTPase-GDP dissociation stimulator vimar [Condylostylus longicornis]